MSKLLSNDETSIWHRLVESHKAFASASSEFLSEGVNRVKLIRSALRGKDKTTAIYMLQYLQISELTQLFSDLVFQASFSHGAIQIVRDAILSLPREWVLESIEEAAEPLLHNGTYDEYRRLLELYIELDHNLTFRLAKRAVEQTDEDIREAGQDFLDRLRQAAKVSFQEAK